MSSLLNFGDIQPTELDWLDSVRPKVFNPRYGSPEFSYILAQLKQFAVELAQGKFTKKGALRVHEINQLLNIANTPPKIATRLSTVHQDDFRTGLTADFNAAVETGHLFASYIAEHYPNVFAMFYHLVRAHMSITLEQIQEKVNMQIFKQTVGQEQRLVVSLSKIGSTGRIHRYTHQQEPWLMALGLFLGFFEQVEKLFQQLCSLSLVRNPYLHAARINPIDSANDRTIAILRQTYVLLIRLATAEAMLASKEPDALNRSIIFELRLNLWVKLLYHEAFQSPSAINPSLIIAFRDVVRHHGKKPSSGVLKNQAIRAASVEIDPNIPIDIPFWDLRDRDALLREQEFLNTAVLLLLENKLVAESDRPLLIALQKTAIRMQ
jgi:hypothetical protein